MKILVAVKLVSDPAAPVLWQQGRLQASDSQQVINPFDAIALEEAVQWREKGLVHEVVTVTIAPAASLEACRIVLALGADRGLLVEKETPLPPLARAHVLAQVARQEAAGVVIMGKQGVDEDQGQTGPMLAALLAWPQATAVSRLAWQGAELLAEREVDGGLEQVILPLPAVITVDLRLNTPRYASLPAMLKARGKPLQRIAVPHPAWTEEALSLPVVEPAAVRRAEKQVLPTVDSLAALLQPWRKANAKP